MHKGYIIVVSLFTFFCIESAKAPSKGYMALLKESIASRCGCVKNAENVNDWLACRGKVHREFDEKYNVQDEKLLQLYAEEQCAPLREAYNRWSSYDDWPDPYTSQEISRLFGAYEACVGRELEKMYNAIYVIYPERWIQFKEQKFKESVEKARIENE